MVHLKFLLLKFLAFRLSNATPTPAPEGGKVLKKHIVIYEAPHAQKVFFAKRTAIFGTCGLSLVYIPLMVCKMCYELPLLTTQCRPEVFASPSLMLDQFTTTGVVCFSALFFTGMNLIKCRPRILFLI